jgi:hypothetical protein
MKTVLAFLQNQWFKDPKGVKAIYERNPDKRNVFIARFLFMGCLTGKRLQKAFGAEVCNSIIWEEASPEVGGTSDSAFKADLVHIEAAILKHNPQVILCFGKIANDAVKTVVKKIHLEKGFLTPVLYGPHPAARHNTLPELCAIAAELPHTLAKQRSFYNTQPARSLS